MAFSLQLHWVLTFPLYLGQRPGIHGSRLWEPPQRPRSRSYSCIDQSPVCSAHTLPARPATEWLSLPHSHCLWPMPCHLSWKPWQDLGPFITCWVLSSAEIGRKLGGDGKCKKSKLGGEESWETGEASLGEWESICSSVLGSNKGLSDLHYCICAQASQGLRELCLGGLVQSQAATY